MYVLSACQPMLPFSTLTMSSSPRSDPSSLTLLRAMISWPPISSISPKRRAKATCCSLVRCWAGKTNRAYSSQAARSSCQMGSSSSASFAPVTKAPNVASIGSIRSDVPMPTTSVDLGPLGRFGLLGPLGLRSRPAYFRSGGGSDGVAARDVPRPEARARWAI